MGPRGLRLQCIIVTPGKSVYIPDSVSYTFYPESMYFITPFIEVVALVVVNGWDKS